MKKISISIDLKKIDRSRIEKKSYTNKDGHNVEQSIYKMDVVPLKEPTVAISNERYTLNKTHFVCDTQTKEERAEKKATSYLGEGLMFGDKALESPTGEVKYPESVDTDDIPFD